jgi:glucose-1-phosphate adenylyltransferase
MRKEMIAMLLAGGQGSRLGILTKNKAKPAVPFGGKYRIIDFPMSNCINSGIDTVGVLTQYQPLSLNQHIGIGIPWDLDRQNGGVSILAPYHKESSGEWYMGTAHAIHQNIDYIDTHNPEYVLILSGDHIYKMDYAKMLKFHKENNCDVTIAVLEVPMEEANRFGILNTRDDDSVYEFEEKPEKPVNNLASMGIYIFNWSRLKKALIEAQASYTDSDFGKHILPLMLEQKAIMYAYRFDQYWKDVGTIDSYWSANMELIKTLPEFNLYEDFWKIYTNSIHQPPQYSGINSEVRTSLLSEGCTVYGKVQGSILGPGVTINEGAVVIDSIIMANTTIGANTTVLKCIVDENTVIGSKVMIGEGDNIANLLKPKVYDTGITVIGENSYIPNGVVIGKNCAILGETNYEHYDNKRLESGCTIDVTAKEVTL